MKHEFGQYTTQFLSTGDYSKFHRGDAEALHPFIVTFCLENEIVDIMDSNETLSRFAESLIDEIEQSNFKRFLDELEGLVDKFGLDYHSSADAPEFDKLAICLSFDLGDENKIDKLIRHIRNNLTNNFNHELGNYPLEVWKSQVRSAKCWSVDFKFTVGEWDLNEDIQG